MSWLDGVRHRLRTVFRSDAYDRELREELHLHGELRSAQPGPHARPFGNVTYYQEETRQATWLRATDVLAQDLRYAVRGMRARPAFAAGVILTLGLGIGANAAMFGITDRILFRSPPMMRDPGTVHRLYRLSQSDNGPRIDRNLAFPTFLDVRGFTPSVFSDVAAFQTRQIAIGEGASAREARVTVASANYFGFFDVAPALGRFFTARDDSVGVERTVVLGYGYWIAEFGGRDVIGQQLRVGPGTATIVGVAPAGFVGMADQGEPAAYIPITPFTLERMGPGFAQSYGSSWLELIARRRAGVSEPQAQAALEAAFTASWRNAFTISPRWGSPEARQVRAVVGPIQIGRGPQAGRDAAVARWVSGVAVIVLLIACANVANLMLARAVSRRREVAVRLALGVSRGRLVRQLLTESAVLAASGGLVGLATAKWGGSVIRALYLPSDVSATVFTDPRTLVFAALATLAAAFLTGVVPAFNAGRDDVVTALKAGEREGGETRTRLRRSLLVFQASLSVILLVGAGLFVRSLSNAREISLGYDTDRVVLGVVNMRGVTLDSAQSADLGQRLLAGAQSLPGVAHAAMAISVPFYSNSETDLFVPGIDSVRKLGRFLAQAATSDYFATVGTRILRGRGLTDADRSGAALAMVVSEGMARVLWPGTDAIGKCVHVNVAEAPCTTVVGVAENIRLRSLTDSREFTYYLPASQSSRESLRFLMARFAGDADQVASLRTRLQAELPSPAYVRVLTMGELVDPNFRAWSFGATMFAAFGGLALVLAAIGLYSLIAYDVAQRAREMSLRIALGAQGVEVVRMVVGRGLVLVGGGVAAGLVAAAWLAPRMQSMMLRVDARDPLIFAGVAVILLITGVVASVVPASRAARVDPADALRGD